MRLRVSGQHTDDDYDMLSVIEGASDTSGLAQGDLMNAFAEGVCNRDPAQTAAARKGIVDALGEAAMVDAAAVIAAFNAYPRAADATGIPIEEFKIEPTADLREELALDALPSRH
jgi:hypothetical protein